MANQKQPEPAWITAIKDLDVYQFRTVKLVIDGYNVSFQNQTVKRESLIWWYVDGTWKGEYLGTDSPIGAKFGRPRYFNLPKKLYEIERRFHGKKAAEKKKVEYRTLCGYMNTWGSTKSLIAHLKNTCTTFEVIDPN